MQCVYVITEQTSILNVMLGCCCDACLSGFQQTDVWNLNFRLEFDLCKHHKMRLGQVYVIVKWM